MEMKDRINFNKDIVIWFSSFLVYNPVSRDTAFHAIYLKVLHKINSSAMYKEIKKLTYLAINTLLTNLKNFDLD
jgi:hypothetical protein